MKMVEDSATGKKEAFSYLVPIQDPQNVNKRRKKAGFDSTVEDNALKLGVTYKVYTLQEIKELTKP